MLMFIQLWSPTVIHLSLSKTCRLKKCHPQQQLYPQKNLLECFSRWLNQPSHASQRSNWTFGMPCEGGFTSHDVKWKKAQGFHQHVHHLPAGDGLWRGIQQCNEQNAQQLLLQMFAPRWTRGQPVASRACHGFHCLGPKDGSYLLHRHIDTEGLVACEQTNLFGYREPAKWGKVWVKREVPFFLPALGCSSPSKQVSLLAG